MRTVSAQIRSGLGRERIRACLWLGEAIGAYPLTAGEFRQITLLLLFRSEQ